MVDEMGVKVLGSRSLLTKWKFSNIWSKSVGRRRKVALVHKIVICFGPCAKHKNIPWITCK